MSKNLSAGTKQILLAALPFSVVIILFIVVVNFGLSKVSKVRSALTEVQKDRSVLIQKLDVLRNVELLIGESTNVTLSALPESNPALLVVSQIKLLASENSVLISGVKSGGEVSDKNGIMRVDISFEVSAPRSEVISFIKAIKTIAPIVTVDKLRLSENGGMQRSTVFVRSFWSPLPTKLPSLTTRIADLTDAERKIVADIESLKKPEFIQLPASMELGKSDPFSP